MTQQPYYETMYILRPDIPEEEVESHVTKYRDILTEAGAEVLDNQMRGKRRLAYPIAKHKEGIYVQLSHNGDGQQVGVIEKAMRLRRCDSLSHREARRPVACSSRRSWNRSTSRT